MVLSRENIGAMLKQLTGTMRLIVMLLYGTGVRITECVDLRVKDLDFDRHQITLKTATTSARCRNCSGIATCRRP